MQYTIKVENCDFIRGERCGDSSCAIALAIKRQVPNIQQVSVTGYHIEINNKIVQVLEDYSSYMYPKIEQFDNNKRVEPFSFNIVIGE